MLKGIDVNERIEFVSKEDVSDPKTVFVFKLLSGAEMIGFSRFMEDGQLKLSGDNVIDFIDNSIVEIKNFSNDLPKRSVISSLPANILTELFTQISKINNLSKGDEKN